MDYNKLYQLLLKSFDEELTTTEHDTLNSGLAHSEALRQEKERLERTEELLTDFSFGYAPKFEQDVMIKLKGASEVKENDWLQSLVALFPKVAFSGLAVIAIMLVTIYYSEGMLSWEAVMGIEDLTSDSAEYLSLQ